MLFTSKQPSLSTVQDDLARLVDDVRALLSVKELDAIPEIRGVRQRIDEGLASARDSADQVLQQTRHAAACADQYAKDEPWRIAGAALAVGALVTYVMCRR